MGIALEHIDQAELTFRVRRARVGVLLLILSDLLTVTSLLAAGGFLSALNVQGQFKIAGDHAPDVLPGVLLAVALVLSGLAYFWWSREARRRAAAGPLLFIVLAVVFLLAALVFQIWSGASLKYGSPFHAYESLLLLFAGFSAFHLILASLIGLLLIGRVVRGRMLGHSYITEVMGYWWYYTVISGLIMWLVGSFIL